MTDENQTQVISWDINKAAIAEVAEDLKDIDAYRDLKGAKAAKKTLTKMRTALGEAHKETKAEALAFGRLVDAKKNEYLALIREIEDPITAQLDEIKNAEAKAEEERVQIRMTEIERIQAYSLDRHDLDLDQLEERLKNLREQECDVEHMMEWADDWDLAKQEADLKLRLSIDRERTRIEEERKQQEIAEENARKQKELDDRQAAMDLEEAERKAIQDKADQERREKEDKEARERQEELDAQQVAIDEQQKELDDIAREEERKKAKEEAEALALAQAPDRDKLLLFANAVDHLIGVKPTLDTDAGNEILLNATAMLIEVAHDIRTSTEEMK
jgi:hypothetical protein